MQGPKGVEIKIGQVWQEVEPRFPDRFVTVVGLNEAADKVQIQSTMCTWWSKAARFDGKISGYKLWRDV